MNTAGQDAVYKDNLTDLTDALPSSDNPSQDNPQPSDSFSGDTQPSQDLSDNQVVGTDGDVVDLGETPEDITSK